MNQLRLGRVSEDTIRNALLYIRAECIRDGTEGVEHVEALLRLRGHDPVHVPKKTERRFARGKLRVAILRSLREGPKTGPEIAAYVAEAEGMAYGDAYKRVYQALHKLRHEEAIAREKDRMRRYAWRLGQGQ